jgi:riboflavin biosynthesis pyrimidine reductase
MEIKAVSPKELEEIYLNLVFPTHPDRPTVAINMVASFDGAVTVNDPDTGKASEKGLGSKVDQRMMRILRTHADATLNGAATLKISGTEPLVPTELQKLRTQKGRTPIPMAFVLTSEGKTLPLGKDDPKSDFFYSPDFEGVVFLTDKATEEIKDRIKETGRKVEVISDDPDNVVEMLKVMKEKYHVEMLLCEGGPGVNGSLIKNGLVDHFFLTFAPKIVAGGKHPVELNPPLTFGSLVEMEPVTILSVPETGETFFHYQFK